LLPLRELISRPEDTRKTYVFRGGVERLQDTMNVRTGAGTGYTIRAEIQNPDGRAQGVLMAQGGRYGGFTLFVKDRHVHFEINSFGHVSGTMVSKSVLPNGYSVIEIEVKPDAPRPPSQEPLRGASPFPGRGTMKIDGTEQASTAFVNIPASGGYWSPAESLDVGSDLGSAVSKEYASPNRFTGTIETITLELHEMQGSNNAARNDGHS
jgi:hypothetical protein